MQIIAADVRAASDFEERRVGGCISAGLEAAANKPFDRIKKICEFLSFVVHSFRFGNDIRRSPASVARQSYGLDFNISSEPLIQSVL